LPWITSRNPDRRPGAAEPTRMFAIEPFTDIMRSTEQARQLDDRR
jgi:hypothetical protein